MAREQMSPYTPHVRRVMALNRHYQRGPNGRHNCGGVFGYDIHFLGMRERERE